MGVSVSSNHDIVQSEMWSRVFGTGDSKIQKYLSYEMFYLMEMSILITLHLTNFNLLFALVLFNDYLLTS